MKKLFNFNPQKDLFVVILSWVLVVSSLSIATNIVTAQNGVIYFLLYAVLGAGIFGLGIPLLWTIIKNKGSLSDLGITKKNLKISLILQVIFSLGLYFVPLKNIELPPLQQLIPLISLSLAIGFFEAIFWRGWVQLRLEKSFGIIPGIILGSLVYALYHVGYGMPWEEIKFLFFIGLMYATTFRLTKNIFILFPFFQPIGQLLTLLKDQLQLPLIASLGFIEVFIAMIVSIWLLSRYSKKHSQNVK